MTKRTTDAEDFADYTDDHQDKEPIRDAHLGNGNETDTPDVDKRPDHEPPD